VASAFQHICKNNDMLRYKWDELSGKWNMGHAHYRLLIISLVLFATGLFSTGINAQEGAPPPMPIFIGYEFVAPENAERLDETVLSLQAQLATAFANAGVQVVFIEDGERADLSINLNLVDHLFVDIRLVNPHPTQLPSPFLLPHVINQIPLSGDLENPRLQEMIVDILVALGTYIRGDCETTVQKLSSVMSLLDSVAIFADQLTGYLDFYLGTCALIAEDYEGAAAYYQTSIDIYAANDAEQHRLIEPSVNLAWIIFEEMGDPGRAFELLQLPRAPHTERLLARALAMQAYLHAAQGQHNEAMNVVEEALGLMPDEPYPVILSGQIFLVLDDVDGAWGEFDWAVKSFGKDFPEVYFHRGAFLVSIDEEEEALYDFEDYLASDPDGPFARDAQRHLDEINGN
jgi:tetratricopeptide (TPR) repeat protein